jgi:hypothetical protein
MLAIGTQVRIKRGMQGGMKEFEGRAGEIIGRERDGRTNMYRVKLYKPVEIPGVGKVEDDLWSAEHLTDIDDNNDPGGDNDDADEKPDTQFRALLTKGFGIIRARGYEAHEKFWCCQSCGCAALPEGTKNYVFYHEQDEERIREAEKRGLRPDTHLAWGGDGEEIRKAFLEAGLAVTWGGDENTRILVSLPPR